MGTNLFWHVFGMEENLSFNICDICSSHAYNIHKFLLYILLTKFDSALKYFSTIHVILFIMITSVDLGLDLNPAMD
jgi:hypothetical protein